MVTVWCKLKVLSRVQICVPIAESVPDKASVHTRNAAFEAVSALEQYCSAPLLKVERSVSDRFLKRSELSMNTFIGAEITTEPRFGK